MDSEVDDLPNVFKDLEISVYSKALDVASNLLSDNTIPYCIGRSNSEIKRKVSPQNRGHISDVPQSSTPKIKNNREKASDALLVNSQSFVSSKSEKNPISILSASDDSINNSFTPEKLLEFCDKQRFLTVEKVIMERIRNMQETDKFIHDNLEQKWRAEQEEASAKRLLLEQKILDDIHEQEMKNRPIREAQLAEDNMKNAKRVLERIQKIKDSENEARRKSEALQLYRKRRDKMLECQKEYCQSFKETYALMETCKNKILLSEKCDRLIKDFKTFSIDYENAVKKTKMVEVTEEDVEIFVKLVERVKETYEYLKKEIESINLNSKEKKEPVIEKIKEVDTTKDTPVENSNQNDLSDCFDSQSLKTYLNLKTYLSDFEKQCQNLAEDNSMKKFRFNCQKAVTIPVNAISPVSSAHLSDKYIKLHNLLSGKMVDIGGIQMCAAQHPNGIAYCKKLLAMKFVRQGDLTVSSKPDAAFAISAVLVSLWVDFPDFGQLTLAYFQNFCPYLAPVFLPQVEGQTVEEYYKSLGYHYAANGEVEKQDSFLKRMSGIMRLYAAVIISKVRQPGKHNPLGLAEGWRWISGLLNLEPRPDICATLLYDFLEVAGNEMFRVYGAQFKKLLAYICQEYFPRLEKVTPPSSGGPIVRLEQFLQKIMKNGSIPPPNGLLPPNFW